MKINENCRAIYPDCAYRAWLNHYRSVVVGENISRYRMNAIEIDQLWRLQEKFPRLNLLRVLHVMRGSKGRGREREASKGNEIRAKQLASRRSGFIWAFNLHFGVTTLLRPSPRAAMVTRENAYARFRRRKRYFLNKAGKGKRQTTFMTTTTAITSDGHGES